MLLEYFGHKRLLIAENGGIHNGCSGSTVYLSVDYFQASTSNSNPFPLDLLFQSFSISYLELPAFSD